MNTKDIILYSAVVVLILALLFITTHPSLQHIKPVDNTIEIERNNALIDSLEAEIDKRNFVTDSIKNEYDKKKIQIKYKIIYNEKKLSIIDTLSIDSIRQYIRTNY